MIEIANANTNDNSCIPFLYGCTVKMQLIIIHLQIQMMALVRQLFMDVLIRQQ